MIGPSGSASQLRRIVPMCRRPLRLILALPAFLASSCTSGQQEPGNQSPDLLSTMEIAAVHESLLTLDSHASFTSDPLRSCGDTERQVDLPKMRHGGLDAVFFSVYAGQERRTERTRRQARAQALDAFYGMHRLAEQCSDAGLARSPDDVVALVEEGKFAIAIGMENGFMLGGELSMLEHYAELGAAYLGLTHDGHNDLADSAIPREELGDVEQEHGGVSPLGEQVIAESNRLGVMVDVAHLSKAATLDAIRLSDAPVISSHSSMYALAPHPRNLDDETMMAMAEKGGVVQIAAVHEFLVEDPPEATEAFYDLLDDFDLSMDIEARTLPPERRAEFEARLARIEERWPLATVADFIDHIDHAVALVGVDHVGIGSDFDGGARLDGWAHAGESMNVTAELLRRGYSEEEIGMIWGGNLLRVWGEVRAMANVAR